MDLVDEFIVVLESGERELIDKLLEFSESQESEEDFDCVVIISSWDEVVCGWKQIVLNV